MKWNSNLYISCTGLAVLLLLAPQVDALTREVTLHELQSEVVRHFPVTRDLSLASMTLTDPKVVLREHSDRIGMRVTVTLSALGEVTGKARGLIDGRLRYASATGEFFLDQPKVQELSVTGVEPAYQEDVRSLVEALAQQALADLPVYRLEADDPQQSLTRLFLQSVEVSDGKLILELDL